MSTKYLPPLAEPRLEEKRGRDLCGQAWLSNYRAPGLELGKDPSVHRAGRALTLCGLQPPSPWRSLTCQAEGQSHSLNSTQEKKTFRDPPNST